jgi:subtilisin family serine protease
MLGALAALAPAQEPAAPPARWTAVLLKDQLCPPPGGFGAFVQANTATPRRKLRATTRTALKKRALAAQATFASVLPAGTEVRALWVVNAVVAKLTPDQAKGLAARPDVLGVFGAGPVHSGGGRGRVSQVITPPLEREPFTAEGKQIPWNLRGLKAPGAWSAGGATGAGTIVAMLDMGTNYAHTDLRNNMWVNRKETPNNGIDDDGNHTPEVKPQRQHHGTWTASVVGGDGTGGTVTGVAPRTRLMVLRAGGFYLAARAFEYALDHDADVISMSFSIPGLGQARALWRLMCEHASAAGMACISGAGNFQQNQPIPVQIRIPEGIPCVICAGGVNPDRSLPRFVSLGPVEWASVKLYGDHPMPGGLIKPDVCAYPGPNIALIHQGDAGYLPPANGKRGNSLSAPHVAGACALMLSVNPDLHPWQLQALLQRTAEDIPPAGKDPKTGAGLMNIHAAVRAAKAAKTPEASGK